MKEIQLSDYGNASAGPAPVSRMMAQFAADFRPELDINLGVGYVNENTIPHQLILEALHAVVRDQRKYQHALNYGEPQGSRNLIESIKKFLVENRIGGLTRELLDKNEIIIAVSGATSLLEAVAHVLPPGLVVTSDPVYYIYCHYLERMGFEIVAVPEDNQGIDADMLQQKLASLGDRKSDIRFIYLVTVNNPTCTILSNSRKRRILEITADLSKELGRKIPLILDMAYEHLVHDPAVEPPVSLLPHDELGIAFEIYTLSKILAPALRIGYLIGLDCPFLRALVQKTGDVGFSAPLINQQIASYILDHHAADQISAVNRGYREKALRTKEWIDQYLGDYISDCRGGSAGFYYYLTFKEIQTHEQSPFFKFLTRTTGEILIDGPVANKNPRVIYLPGQFCVHHQGRLTRQGRRQLRLSYGYEELPRIESALKIMPSAADYALT